MSLHDEVKRQKFAFILG